MQIYYLLLYFFTYGFLGWCTEVAFASVKQNQFVNRGFLNGPICPIYGVGVSAVVVLLKPWGNQIILLYAASVILVTLIEGITGYAMDKIFHHKWWDYSGQPLNIGGYVCIVFSLVWGVACVLIMKVIHPLIHKVLSFLPEMAGIVLIVLLCAVLCADLYVTASGILKFNRRLEAMEKIAAELHEISDKVGINIHENVMDTIEKQEEGKRKLEEATADIREKLEDAGERFEDMTEETKTRIKDLKTRYAELAGTPAKVAERLMKAFPKMESRKYNDILHELKETLEEKLKKE